MKYGEIEMSCVNLGGAHIVSKYVKKLILKSLVLQKYIFFFFFDAIFSQELSIWPTGRLVVSPSASTLSHCSPEPLNDRVQEIC